MKRAKLIASAVTFAAVASTATAASAQTVTWMSSSQYDIGYAPVVAANGLAFPDLLEQHTAYSTESEIWLNSGGWGWSQIGGGNTFGQNVTTSWQTIAGDSSYDSTLFVSVDAFPSGANYAETRYRTGRLNPTSFAVTWSADTYLGAGMNPSVAQATSGNGTTEFILFVEGSSCSGNSCSPTGVLWYATGTLNSDKATIAWNALREWTGGWAPSVTIAPVPGTENEFFVVDAHEGQNGEGSLWADYGVLTAGASTVNWTNTVHYDNGTGPSVAICEESGYGTASVIEVHYAGTAGWYHTGRIAPLEGYAQGTVNFGPSYEYDVGQAVVSPTVACSGSLGVEVHQDATAYWAGNGTVVSYGLHETRFQID